MTCPKCGANVTPGKNFCEQCGADLRQINLQNDLLENDPVLSAMNSKYAKCGICRLISGAAVALSIALVYNWLENNIAEVFGDIGFLLFLPALIVFVVSCIVRGAMKKRIRRELSARVDSINAQSSDKHTENTVR